MTVTLSPPAAPSHAPRRRKGIDREHLALAALLVVTAVAYLCNLSANGWANSFYSAAVQAGSQSWKAFFFGSSDAANSITVDKPPASLWVMELSVRLFGLNSWSILVPQVLLGVATVALLWATVRRPFGPAAGLLAGLALALTPVATLMFRFNNPDALLVLLMVAAAWAITRAVADGRTRWLVLAGVFVGFGFLTKQLQVLLVVPALALTYLVAGPPALGRRIAQLCAAGASMIVSAGWWLLAVEWWPADSRPWIGGSHENSILELTLGYNGLGRLNGNERGSVGGGGGELPAGGNGMWGSTGIGRLFDSAQGGQIAWLIPAALLGLLAVILMRGKASRTDPRRAAAILWGGWLVITGLVFSFMAGIFHSYYTVALAPAVAALAAAGGTQLWRERRRPWARALLALTIALTTWTAWILLSRTTEFQPWLRWTVLATGTVATVATLIPAPRRLAAVTAVAAVCAGLAGPAAYSAQTLSTGHSGSIPSAGPNAGGFGFGPMHGGARSIDGDAHGMPQRPNTPPDGGPTGNGAPTDGGDGVPGADGDRSGSPDGSTTADDGGMRGGGLLDAQAPGSRIVALLESDADEYTWVAATVGSNSAAGYQLATELPVMPIGGFNGSDPSPTLDEFRRYVAEGRIHYFIGGRGGPSGNSEIITWVEQNYTAIVVDGVTLYDLTPH